MHGMSESINYSMEFRASTRVLHNFVLHVQYASVCRM